MFIPIEQEVGWAPEVIYMVLEMGKSWRSTQGDKGSVSFVPAYSSN
jgi:hypothetical protein